jgi:hypothetical protein
MICREFVEKLFGMQKICLVFLVTENFDCSTVFERAFKEVGFSVETVRVPYREVHLLNREYVKELRTLLKEKSRDSFLIFSPQSTELHLEEPDLTIAYSAYRSWFDEGKMRVIPHLWTPIKPPQNVDYLTWTSKPPLRIGFMGRDYTNSRFANIVLKSPSRLKQWLLRGFYLHHAGLMIGMNRCGISAGAINAFARIETMNALKANAHKFSDVQLDIVEKQRFGGSELELSEFTSHLERNTYIVCPRGTENYSYRIYETLGRGRIPIIIDTDMVLPKEINWDYLSVRVPYESLNKIYEFILRDYQLRSEAEFIARQKEAFSAMIQLQTMSWVKDIAVDLESAIEKME